MARKRFILSVDGGGIRGIVPAVILKVLERKLKDRGKDKPLYKYFDMMAGTSTGAIVAAGLAMPSPDGSGNPAADPQALVDLYKLKGHRIFDQSAFAKLRSFFTNTAGLREEKYSAVELETILQSQLGENTMLDRAQTRLLITGYDIEQRRAVFMSSTEAPKRNYVAWEAIRGSTAAPTYFEPARVRQYKMDDGGELKPTLLAIIDGGVFANDPALAALVEARKLGWATDMKDIVVLSLGTGHQTRRFNYNEAKSWGALSWISPSRGSPIISILMQGQASTVGYQMNNLLNEGSGIKMAGIATDAETGAGFDEASYIRIDDRLYDGINDDLDDASKENLHNLEVFAHGLSRQHEDALEALADMLVERND